MKHSSLLLVFDPRWPTGYATLASRPNAVPDEVPNWFEHLQAALDEAEDLHLEVKEVLAVEERREDATNMNILASPEMPIPEYYEHTDQLVLHDFISRLLPVLPEGKCDELRSYLTLASILLRYAIDNKLWVRIGERESLVSERAEVLVPEGRRGESITEAELTHWVGLGPPEFPAAEHWINELLHCAEGVGVNATKVREAEAFIRRLQPAPGRLRLDEDIVELLTLVETVLSKVDNDNPFCSHQLQSQLNRLAVFLRFVRDEGLLMCTRTKGLNEAGP